MCLPCLCPVEQRGSCLLQVSLLDPVVYPGAVKAFAKEVCRKCALLLGICCWCIWFMHRMDMFWLLSLLHVCVPQRCHCSTESLLQQ